MKRSRSVSLALVGLLLLQTGCVKSTQVGIGEIPADGAIQLRLKNGDEVTMRAALVETDSIRGQVKRPSRLGGPAWADTAAFPLAEVESVVVQESDGAATAGLIVAVVLFPVLMFMATCSGDSDGYVC